ncbi:MAG: GHKL domain-containing protein [Lachnospiraceae bacterium]|nr:GHKL domain-containing protein [Lachnospiraceae bacterium]
MLMAEFIMRMLSIPLYLFEGYCIRFFFSRFAEPRLCRIKNAQWMAGIVWILIRIANMASFHETDNATLVVGLVFNTAVLFLFCMGWYKGNMLLKIFLVIQFISLRELAFLAGYSFLYIGNSLIDILVHGMGYSMESPEYLLMAVEVLSCFSVAFVVAIEGVLLLASVRKIVKSYHCREKGQMDREVVFYLLPAMAGVLVAVLVRLLMITVTEGIPVLLYDRHPALYIIIPMIAFVLLGAIVFSFRIYQNMVTLQEERAEKIILENQITQMQSSMVEMEQLYDGIRSVKHDMKNHMAVLQNLIRKKYSGEDEEIRQYFEGMYQSVEQLDSRVHTGNAVSDAVVGSKFSYAAKKVKGVKLDAGSFMLSDAVTIKAYDIGIILNNGLDNAIEACMRMKDKQPDAEVYITIRSFRAKNMYFIEIENSFDGAALFDKDSGLPISTKEDKEVHGIGLKNIRKCAVKYGGDMDCIVKGNRFILSVMVKS